MWQPTTVPYSPDQQPFARVTLILGYESASPTMCIEALPTCFIKSTGRCFSVILMFYKMNSGCTVFVVTSMWKLMSTCFVRVGR